MDLRDIDFMDADFVESNGKSLRSQLEYATLAVMHSTGDELGLLAVAWRVEHRSEGLLIAGTFAGSDAHRVCLAWASALTLSEYATTREDGGREWVGLNGPWRIELRAMLVEPIIRRKLLR